MLNLLNSSINSRFTSDLFVAYLFSFVSIASGFLLAYLLSNFGGLDLYGNYALILATAGFITSFLSVRSGESVIRFFVREITNGKLNNAKMIINLALFSDFLLGIIVFLAIFIFSDIIANNLLKASQFSYEVSLFGVVSCMTLYRNTMVGYFQSYRRFKLVYTLQILELVGRIMIIVLFVLVNGTITLLDLVKIFVVTATVITIILSTIFVKDYLKRFSSVPRSFNGLLLKEYAIYTFKVFFSSTLKSGHQRIDEVVLGIFSTPATVGVYNILKKITSAVVNLVNPLGRLTLPSFTELYSEENYKEFHDFIRSGTLKIVFVVFSLLGIVYFALPFILPWFNIKQNSDVKVCYSILMIYPVLASLMWWGRNFIVLYNPSIPIYSNGLLLVNSVLFPTVIFSIGMLGELASMAVAFMSAYCVSYLIGLIAYFKFYRRNVAGADAYSTEYGR